jgi:nitroreductase
MTSLKITMSMLAVYILSVSAWAGVPDLPDVPLPVPHMTGGKPLMQALKERQSSRSFSAKKLSVQVLSDLLWAGAGINRPDSGKRTAPSAMDRQEVDVYVVLEEGAYLYDAKSNSLKAVMKGDLRKLTGSQGFVATAPLNLAYVADMLKMKGTSPEDQVLYSAASTGFISQNVYLFCASEGLATVVRASVDRKTLAKALNFSEDKKIILVQTVGYPGP